MSFPQVLVFLHVMAAISWIGGMMFLSVVLAPLIRSQYVRPECLALFRAAARRFRVVVWVAMVILLCTGPLLLEQRGWSLADAREWPGVVQLKIILVIVLLMLTLSHDLLPAQRRKLSGVPPPMTSSRERAYLHISSWLPRVALLIAFGVVAVAVVLARL